MKKVQNMSRYVFHVSSPQNRLSILKNGLVAKKKQNRSNGIYAHNDFEPKFMWYPMFFDAWLQTDDEFHKFLSYFDYWRIDTHAIENIWYEDLTMKRDAATLCFIPKNFYVFTKENIPIEHIELYKFQAEEVIIKLNILGAASMEFKPQFRPYDINIYLK